MKTKLEIAFTLESIGNLKLPEFGWQLDLAGFILRSMPDDVYQELLSAFEAGEKPHNWGERI